jgi:hypothetical protein
MTLDCMNGSLAETTASFCLAQPMDAVVTRTNFVVRLYFWKCEDRSFTLSKVTATAVKKTGNLKSKRDE